MHLFKTPEKYFKVDPWLVIEEGFDPARQRLSESIFSLANEFMCVRGYFEEGYSGDHLLGSYFSQLYEIMDIKHPVFKALSPAHDDQCGGLAIYQFSMMEKN